MMPPFDYSSKEMMKFLALYQALKTIDVMSEEEASSEEEDSEEENGNGESATIIMPLINPVMKKKKKSDSKTSYGQYRRMGRK